MRTKKPAKPRPRGAGQADKALGQRIRLLRVEKKMSQSSLAAVLGVSFQQVQKYEKGMNRVAVPRLQEIAAALDVPVSVFYDKGEPGQVEVQSLLFADSKFSLRLLRAYNAISDEKVRRKFVSLMERVAGLGQEEEEE